MGDGLIVPGAEAKQERGPSRGFAGDLEGPGRRLNGGKHASQLHLAASLGAHTVVRAMPEEGSPGGSCWALFLLSGM